jgi:hypothetical protein
VILLNSWVHEHLQNVYNMSWSSHTLKCPVGGVFITSLTILAVGQKGDCSVVRCTGQSGARRTCPMPWPRQPIVDVCSSRSLDLTVAHTVRCYSLEIPCLRALCADSLVHTRQVLFNIWCATRALADCPRHGFLHCFF